ncbi:MAG: 3-deoxy-D-manno-octulosonic acid transferase [Succinivibrionaceae bacterium]
MFLRCLYNSLINCATPFVYMYLKYGKHNKPYGSKIVNFLGNVDYDRSSPLWIHTVSVGETIGAQKLIKKILEKNPELNIIVTTSTTTSASLYNNFSARVTHFFAPLDSKYAVIKFINKIKPQGLIIMETELWPNILNECHKRNIKTTLINARLSDRSYKRYNYLKKYFNDLIGNKLTNILCQTNNDYKNFKNLGITDSKLYITGSLKYDIQVDFTDYNSPLLSLKKQRFVCCFASTHDNEEEIFINIYNTLKQKISSLLFFIVPRHPERFEEIYLLSSKTNNVIKKTNITENTDLSNIDIIIGNTMGELPLYFKSSNLVIMGGSFTDVGGHNPIEPAYLESCILTGNIYYNFKDVYNVLSKNNACVITNIDKLSEDIFSLYQNPSKRINMGNNALKIVQENQGALNKTLLKLKEIYNLKM